MRRNALAQVIGILIGLVVWLTVGNAVALLDRGIGIFVGLVAGGVVWGAVTRWLQKKWGLSARDQQQL